ncbi:TetR/AcrR family transcriptional regulator [Nocardia halotolerans]|uniref:TetR/AcrR family transcriptional regulator n=1 Tax=Nocardia halotolerans TaxID=1755878 RepID=A0ABV8VTM7_9NOCA
MVTTKPNRPPGRPRVADSMPLETILQVALNAFATHGYDGVSLRTLNKELGASHNLIYQRFGSKENLWRAAVDFGFGRVVRRLEGILDPGVTDPVEQLRLAVREFLRVSAQHPELTALMNFEGRQDTARLAYIFENYVRPTEDRLWSLARHLMAENIIRPIPQRTLHFLITHGGTAPYSQVPLALHFDPASPLDPAAVEQHADLVSTILIDGLRVR